MDAVRLCSSRPGGILQAELTRARESGQPGRERPLGLISPWPFHLTSALYGSRRIHRPGDQAAWCRVDITRRPGGFGAGCTTCATCGCDSGRATCGCPAGGKTRRPPTGSFIWRRIRSAVAHQPETCRWITGAGVDGWAPARRRRRRRHGASWPSPTPALVRQRSRHHKDKRRFVRPVGTLFHAGTGSGRRYLTPGCRS
jgi:hypothetical protein